MNDNTTIHVDIGLCTPNTQALRNFENSYIAADNVSISQV